MIIKTLYRFTRADGGTTVSTEEPSCEYIKSYRLIADENKAITLNGTDLYSVIDTDNTNGWYEVDVPQENNNEVIL